MLAVATKPPLSQHPAAWSAFADHEDIHPIRAELFGLEHLEAHARRLGELMTFTRVERGRPMLQRFQYNAQVLQLAHHAIREAYQVRETLGHDAEWLLDNYYIINDALSEIRTDLPRGYYHRLPKLMEGALAGYPRVYALALELTAHCDSCLSEANITRFTQSFQTVTPLTMGELWAIPIMLRLCLIENLRRLAQHIVQFRDHRRHAKTWIDSHLHALDQCPPTELFALHSIHDDWRDCYVFHLLEGLHDHAVVHPDGVERLEKRLAQTNDCTTEVLRREKQRQAANQVSIGNCVTSLRLLSALDWSKFFEDVSLLEAALRQDPSGVYPRQDFATRDRYRQILEKLARQSKKDELEVVRRLLERARAAAPENQVPGDSAAAGNISQGSLPIPHHIGYYLVDDGRAAFERALGYRPPWRDGFNRFILAHPRSGYFGALAALTLGFLAAVAWISMTLGASWWFMGLIVAVALLPLSELAVGWTNFVMMALVPPRTLPRFSFKEGVPGDCATFVVIPTLLTQPESAAGLVERLEIHSLSNPEKNLYFALLTDFSDAPEETMPGDDACLEAAKKGVEALNAKYGDGAGAGAAPRFFLLHRRRQWNPSQNCWMGWERKRGKLMEFNRLLRHGPDTSFSFVSNGLSSLPRIRFVITLDTDTQLPREAARRLIATLAHPLNQPQFDPRQRRVVRGYGILQPRVSLSLRGGRKSLFARLFTGSAGLDPYTTAVSDTYQDLFGSGSFTGKGIYDLDAFEAATQAAFPANTILSHDLIEGNYARCGLVTDVELLDDFPFHYQAFARREHRWVRGDWQILPWLGRRVPGPQGGRLANPLPFLERWKIFDNLRRSLVPPALVLLLVLGWTLSPGLPWVWSALAAVVLASPLLLQILTLPGRLVQQWIKAQQTQATFRDLTYTAGQAALSAIFLADQALNDLDAIVRTLYRVGVCRRHLLEWESSAATEGRLHAGLTCFTRAMWPASLLAGVIGGCLALTHPESLLPAGPWLLCWLLSPLVAWGVSQLRKGHEKTLSTAQEQELHLLARKTWSFFETFVEQEDHWLPPDNFQEDPRGEIAHRTSPTNIGLYLLSCVAAHDLGYLSWPALIARLEKTFATLEDLERSHGHLYNWYDTQTLKPLPPLYISTVDSGNLAACLLALKQGLLEKCQSPLLGKPLGAGMEILLGLIDRELQSFRSPAHGRDREVWGQLERALRTLQSQLQQAPTQTADAGPWLDRLSGEQVTLQAQLERLQSSIGEKVTGLQGWVDRLGNLIRDRRAEISGILSCCGTSPQAASVETLTLASLADGPAPRPAGDSADLNGFSRAHAEPGWANDLWQRCVDLQKKAETLSVGMDFKLLYHEERNLFAVGYNLTQGRLDNSHYDLLASEASLTSFLAVARGDVPKKHWFQLGRALTRVRGNMALFSWGGTMFEYLMPRLLLRIEPGTLLEESQTAAVTAQMDHGRRCGTPWGISESAFSTTDAHLNYQYQAFGVPALGLKRDLNKDLVVAPYASALAVMVKPREVVENLYRLRKEGAEGPFGWYEAIDYTAERLPKGRRSLVVKCFMAHHQGMTLLALANCLLNNPWPRRFHAEPMVRATELLLQERVPTAAPVADLRPAEGATTYHEIPTQMSRRITTPHTVHPRTHLLASARSALMITSAGSCRSSARGLAVNRWREDSTCDSHGQFYYLRNLRTGKCWSAGYQPLCQEPEAYEVLFATDKVEFRRQDDGIETHMEITLSPENHAEVRRLTITNHGRQVQKLEITSYVEVVLATQEADLAHPAFGKLFLETEYLPGSEALLCRRRPRAPEQQPVWGLHVLAALDKTFGPVQYETDRARFLGRGRTPANPAALDPGSGPLSGTTGPVLDPILSLRRAFRVKPGRSIQFVFTTALADTREEALALVDNYRDFHGAHRAFELAWAHAQVELRQLHLTAADTHLFQRLATHLFYAGAPLRAAPALVACNRQGQSDLWRQGISGDLPIVLVRIGSAEELPLARQMMSAHAFWRLKGLTVDLVILNDQEGGYFEDLQQQLLLLVRASDDRALVDKPGGVFVRKTSHLSREDQLLLQSTARALLVGSRGLLGTQLDRLERSRTPAGERLPLPARPAPAQTRENPAALERAALQFDNGLGGFTSEGEEYVLHLTARQGTHVLPPQPWVNVIANPHFGFLVSETGAGFTWAGNSQMHRLTPWHNDPVSDPPAEVLYLRDEASKEVWSATPLPRGAGADYTVRHGQGYSLFQHQRDGVACELTLFVSPDEPLKWYRLKVRNLTSRPKRLSVVYYAEWVLGTQRMRTAPHIVTEVDEATGALLARNVWDADYRDQIAFVDVNQRPRSFTCDRTEFLGRHGSTAAPAGCAAPGAGSSGEWSGAHGACLDPCAALHTGFELPPQEEKEIVFILGEASSLQEARRLIQLGQGQDAVQAAWQASRSFWDPFTTALTIRTPSKALDLLMNRWLPYQVLSCRMWGRSALYQSGGAYGYRDQLQDALALLYAMPSETRRHLLRAAAHQFLEGDVQHWWHPPQGAGVRTRFSDDYLWLPFAVYHYVLTTGDQGVLDEKIPFLQAPLLRPEQEEDYRTPDTTVETASLYEHCVRAIHHGLRFGVHGLPLMGTGDWNDGMNRIGSEGRGESVWTGWFLATILQQFASLCDQRGDTERALLYRSHAQDLQTHLELHAWDGAWYCRAYFDDGRPLGSAHNQECRIDSLAQTWAVIYGRGNPQRARQAMEAVDEQLVRRAEGLVLLFTPPFDKGDLQPGYIKGYVPGIRENGGQYTHAALWVAQAWALLGEGRRAVEILELINPVRHAGTPEAVARYRLEPYVVAADIYGQPPHTGRGGWSWYTGSASWYYRVMVENVLGLQLRGRRFRLQPCLPEDWPAVAMTYRHRSATYEIQIHNTPIPATSTAAVLMDGQPWSEADFPLLDDGALHRIEIYLKKASRHIGAET